MKRSTYLRWIRLWTVWGLGALLAGGSLNGAPRHQTHRLFAPERWHNHAPCLVEDPAGGLFLAWFHGSGERKEDDVRIEGARRPAGKTAWSERFPLADTPGYPDCNPALYVDGGGRLWLFYPTILNHQWEGALLKFRVSEPAHWMGEGSPRWDRSEVLHVTPGPEFDATVARVLPELERQAAALAPQWTVSTRDEVEFYLNAFRANTTNELYRRLGWMPRARPIELGDRLILGVYHDGFSATLMAITDDQGTNWHTSTPLIGGGNIQPSLVTRRDGSIVAYMRDNGPPPKRLLRAESRDRGETWGPVTDSNIPNPGSGADLITLRNGHWMFIGNDTEVGRNSLAVWLSEDEGKTWPHRRHLEQNPSRSFSFGYPSLLEARDGTVHAAYSVHAPEGKTIVHVEFNLEWLKEAQGP